eukprot:3705752-Pleurochrysis_carterae.AAC.2
MRPRSYEPSQRKLLERRAHKLYLANYRQIELSTNLAASKCRCKLSEAQTTDRTAYLQCRSKFGHKRRVAIALAEKSFDSEKCGRPHLGDRVQKHGEIAGK